MQIPISIFQAVKRPEKMGRKLASFDFRWTNLIACKFVYIPVMKAKDINLYTVGFSYRLP